MSDGGKGSKPRPLSVDRQIFDENWDRIFGKSDYQDVLSTEDVVLDSLDNFEEFEKKHKGL